MSFSSDLFSVQRQILCSMLVLTVFYTTKLHVHYSSCNYIYIVIIGVAKLFLSSNLSQAQWTNIIQLLNDETIY